MKASVSFQQYVIFQTFGNVCRGSKSRVCSKISKYFRKITSNNKLNGFWTRDLWKKLKLQYNVIFMFLALICTTWACEAHRLVFTILHQ